MPLRIVIEPIVESIVYGVVEVVSDFAGQVFGESVVARIPLLKKSYSDAYCKSFFCMQCPGTAKGRRQKLQWFLYRCQDCGSEWGALRAKPWVRREKRKRAGLRRGAI
jgi:hypothetical protein